MLKNKKKVIAFYLTRSAHRLRHEAIGWVKYEVMFCFLTYFFRNLIFLQTQVMPSCKEADNVVVLLSR